MKLKTVYICQNCGHESSKWIGKCPSCEAWNSFVEDVIDVKQEKGKSLKVKAEKPATLTSGQQSLRRIPTGISELNRVLGSGIVPGSLILLGGEPGIGKSTLTIQLCQQISTVTKKILYISGEESVEQISMRAARLDINTEKLFLLNQTNLENILATAETEHPDLLIIDSIQVIQTNDILGGAGSISQVRECTDRLMQFAKKTGTPVVLIGHVTKEGQLAGPKVLEHLVDVVLNLEGDRYHQFRVLRGTKNRFGSVSEVGIFEMTEKGLVEVTNASAAFLEGRQEHPVGSCITCTIEGQRPLLIEIQALTASTPFGYPKRAASGYDVNRLQLLIAVLQKHAGINLGAQDVYINVVGGFRISDPATDLAVCLAIISSCQNKPLSAHCLAIGEIGLSGEIRAVQQLDRRIHEAKKLGFSEIVSPQNFPHIKTYSQIIS